MPATTYLSNKLLDHQTGKSSYTMPTPFLGLSSTTPALAGTGITEPVGGSYARVAASGATWSSAAAGSITNASAITFPTASADWASGSSLTFAVLYDASTGGNVLAYGALTVAKSALSGDTISVAASGVTITIS